MEESWAKLPGEAPQVEAGQVEAGVEAGKVEAGQVEAGQVEAGQVEAGQVEAGQASVDLHLELPGTRIRLGLETALRDAVRTGGPVPGTRLPSSRALAADLGLARNTVAEVYTQLVAEGWLTARTGSGTTVAERRAADPGPGPLARPEAAAPRYDLRPGVPDLSAFPA